MDAEPDGAVALVEPQHSHSLFVDAVQPNWALLKLTHARRLVKRGETADSYFGDTNVIVTSTIQDRKRQTIPWDDEFRIIKALQPTAHIPTDAANYVELGDETRVDAVRQVARGTVTAHHELECVETDVIPLIKGHTYAERDMCYQAAARIGAETVAFYGTRYFTGGRGRRINDLVADVTQVATETDRNILVIGVLDPYIVDQLPPAVTACTGLNQWRSRVAPTKDAPEDLQREYATLARDVAAALDTDPSQATDNTGGGGDTTQSTLPTGEETGLFAGEDTGDTAEGDTTS